MSGGSLDYVYQRVDSAADRLLEDKDPTFRAFGAHLKLVQKALHDVEWYLSGDYGREQCGKSLAQILTKADVLAQVVQEAREVQHTLQTLLDRTVNEL